MKEVPGSVLEISSEHRSRAKAHDFSWVAEHYALACHRGVWDEGHNFDSRERGKVIADTDRRGFCFYLEHRPGMLLPAARALQEQEAAQSQSRTDRLLALCGLVIAALALAADVWLAIAANQRLWPF